MKAFVDAIVATPADETLRLVFADWLEENGHPAQAEWVRKTRKVRPEFYRSHMRWWVWESTLLTNNVAVPLWLYAGLIKRETGNCGKVYPSEAVGMQAIMDVVLEGIQVP